MKKFTDYIHHPIPVVQEIAALLKEAQEAYESGDMSRSEFNEISCNLLEYAEIDAASDTIMNKVVFKEVIGALQFISEHLPMA